MRQPSGSAETKNLAFEPPAQHSSPITSAFAQKAPGLAQLAALKRADLPTSRHTSAVVADTHCHVRCAPGSLRAAVLRRSSGGRLAVPVCCRTTKLTKNHHAVHPENS